ncbi:MAG: hypothetical protein ACYC2Y_07850 [Armatimonadota bacterium]
MRAAIAIAVVAFAFFMALRDSFEGLWVRALIAAAGGACMGLAFILASRSRQSR